GPRPVHRHAKLFDRHARTPGPQCECRLGACREVLTPVKNPGPPPRPPGSPRQQVRWSVSRHCLAAIVVVMIGAAAPAAQSRPVDVERSTLTVYVYKSGLFSAFADDHVINAPIVAGTLSDVTPLSVVIEVRAADLRVQDPSLSGSKRTEVQARMVGPEVLD